MDDKNNKLPQNISHLLMEIGEKCTTFQLFLLTKDTPWDVFNNFGEAGCDLLLIHRDRNEKLKIEVKTRQRIYTTGKNPKVAQFTLTQGEYDSCDFVIAYWLEYNYFFVVPKNALTPTSSNGVPLYKFIARVRQNGTLNDEARKYLGKWDLIEDEMKKR